MTDDTNKKENGIEPTPIAAPADALTECERLRDEYLDGWKRAKADLANYKKEEMERFAAVIKFGNEALVKELLIVLDSFDLGIAALEDANPAKHGMRLIESQLLEILKRQGVERITASPGEQFDPSKHEAVGEAPSESPPGAIVEEVGRGYVISGKVIRASRVIISKGQK
jgi:molecular chaperone GrpE